MKNLTGGVFTLTFALAMILQTPGIMAQEPIGVSGYWTVTVSDHDGTNAKVYEFSNALTNEGGSLLESILGKLASDPDDLCKGFSCPIGQLCSNGSCFSVTTCTTADAAISIGQGAMPAKIDIFDQGDLSSPVSLDAIVDTASVWRASWEADRAITIARVSTSLGVNQCSGEQAPAFTQRDLDAPIAVQNGQLVNIEVDISFSTAAAP